MIEFIQHIPTFVESEPEVVEADTLEGILNSEVVQRYKRRGKDAVFMQTPDGGGRYTIMVVYDKGRKWWVVGYIFSDEPIDLPEWKYQR